MKLELTITEENIHQIADAIIERLLPALARRTGAGQPDDALMDVQELAQYMKVDESWIYARTGQQRIPYIKKGKYLLFRRSEIDKWLQQDAVKPLAPFTGIRKCS